VNKLTTIAGAVVAAGLTFLITFVVVVNARGGLGPSRAALAKAPVLGKLLKVQPVPEEVEAEPEEPAPGALPQAGVSFLRFGEPARLQRLAEALDRKRADYEVRLQRLERRERELDAWQKQLEQERDLVRARLDRESEDLAGQRQQLAQERSQVEASQVAIAQAEESNLKKAAQIYARMSSDKAAEILERMYAGTDQDAVVKLIYLMDSRAAAKTLEAFSESQISADITQRLKNIMKSEQSGG